MQTLDWAVLACYFLAVVGAGMWAGRRERDTDDYFLAGRGMGWFPVAVSSLATALSALTFIGVPGASFGGNFVYLQLGVGSLAAQVVLAAVFLPIFYRLKVTTVYELLGHRFGPVSRTAGTCFFIVSRILASSVRLAGCAIAVSVFFGLSIKVSIAAIAFFALLYTVTGGIKAVIWTDMIQFFLFVAGASVALAVVWTALPGGFHQYLEAGRAVGKFTAFKFSGGLNDPESFLVGNFFALVIGVAVGATDQDIAQRLLTCRNVGLAQRSAVVHGIANFGTTLLFLSVGAALFAYYQAFPDAGVLKLVAEGRNDWVFPHFIRYVLPAGLRGLLVAALLAAAMSSLDSCLNGLASTAYIDLYRRFAGDPGGKKAMLVSRGLVVLFGLILAAMAMSFGRKPSILWFGLRIMGYTYGALLGVFLLAVLTKRRGSEWGNVAAMATSILVVLFLTADLGAALQSLRGVVLAPLGVAKIAWPWAIVIGTVWTFGVAAAFPGTGGGSLGEPEGRPEAA